MVKASTYIKLLALIVIMACSTTGQSRGMSHPTVKNTHGFTLLDLMLVLSLMGLAAVLIHYYL